jgi:VWFA-related protein
MRRLLASALVLLLAALTALPQQPQPPLDTRRVPPPPEERQEPQDPRAVIRAAVDLVLVDVQVLDRSGRPVTGLRPEQFRIFEDDKEQSIASFEYFDIEAIESAEAADAPPVMVALGAVADPAVTREAVRDRRLVVLFFDQSSMQPDEQLRAAEAARRYVREQMTAADLVGVVALGQQLRVLVNFTNDRDLLERALARISPGAEQHLAGEVDATPPGEEAVTQDTGAAYTPDETEFNIFNTDRKLAALQGLAGLLRDIPGKKSILYFAGGLTQTGSENRSQLRAAVDAANRANVSFYTVDTRGLQATAPAGDASAASAAGTAMFSGQSVFRQSSMRQDSRDTLATLASDTGGRSFFDLGDFGAAFRSVQEDTSGYYLLGYYSTNPARDGRWRTIRVRVDARGARVRGREGYYAPRDFGRFTAEDRERQLEEAMAAEAPRLEFPVALDVSHFRIKDDEYFVPVAARLASSALQWAERRGRREVEFDFAAEVREEESGEAVAALRDTVRVRLAAEQFQQVARQAIVYQGGVVLGPGRYRMKFLARENESGRIGTFEYQLYLPPANRQRLELSSLLLSSQIEPARRQGGEVRTRALAPDARLEKTPLEVAGERIVPSVTRVFTPQQRLYVLFQAYLPEGLDPARLRAGLIFFRDGQRAGETPLVEAAEFDRATRTAAFRISLPLERFPAGRYTVQAVAVEQAGAHSAFQRNYFALRAPAGPANAVSAAAPGAR